MIELKPCPVCGNTELSVGSCVYRNKTIAYNVYCSMCNFTGRSYKMKIKALRKWNSFVEQNKNITRS